MVELVVISCSNLYNRGAISLQRGCSAFVVFIGPHIYTTRTAPIVVSLCCVCSLCLTNSIVFAVGRTRRAGAPQSSCHYILRAPVVQRDQTPSSTLFDHEDHVLHNPPGD